MSTMRVMALHAGLQKFIDEAQEHMRKDNTVAAKQLTDFASEMATCMQVDNLDKTLALIQIRDIASGAGNTVEKLDRIQDVFDNLVQPL